MHSEEATALTSVKAVEETLLRVLDEIKSLTNIIFLGYLRRRG
jgi:hypothetical protein